MQQLEILWFWKHRVHGSEVTSRCWLGEVMPLMRDEEASRHLVFSILNKLAESHASVERERERLRLERAKHEEYKSKEEARMKELLRRCTELLNSKKRRIRAMEAETGRHGGGDLDLLLSEDA